MFGEESAVMLDTGNSMGCEDFSFVAEEVGGTFFQLGTKNPKDAMGEGTGTNGHHPKFDIDERALPRGAAFFSSFALEWAGLQADDVAAEGEEDEGKHAEL